MIRKFFLACCAVGLCLLHASLAAQTEARLLRFPAIHGNQIVFSYAGDLYSVSAGGGVARRLTSDIGYEMFARFSPNGKQLAFTGAYDGNTEIYVMPAEGGIPRRLTYTATLDRDDVSDRMGPNNIVMGWRDDDNVIYRSRGREWNSFKGQLYLAPVSGGLSQQLPLPRGGFCSYSPDRTRLAYNRIFREFRTWKRYRGGQADDIWIYDFNSKTTTNITNHPAQDIVPMWYGNKIYFISDREQRMNLYVYDIETRETRKLTHFVDFDIKFPSLGDTAIVFENGGYIYRFDLNSERAEKVTIYLQEDMDSGRSSLVAVSKYLTSYEIAPDGKRALFSARGDLFTVPAKYGPTRNLTTSPGAHDRSPKWSPDGKWIAFISDMSGEDEIYLIPSNGSGKAVAVTTNGNNCKYWLTWSPDSKKILWSDRAQRLQFVDIDSKKVSVVAQSPAWEITSFSWSPDNKWITYTDPQEVEGPSIVNIYSLEQNKAFRVTDRWYSSYNATFSEDGKYLYFISNRTFAPIYGWNEWNHVYVDMAKVYLVTLQKDTKSPFAPKSDEVEIKEPPQEPKEAKAAAGAQVTVDLENITARIAELPIARGSYWQLVSVGNRLYYMRKTESDGKSKLCMFDFDSLKETELGECNGFEISADKKKMLVAQNQSYAIIDVPMGRIELKDYLSLSDVKVHLDRHEEWQQIFRECWRQMRDFFYDPNMHGLDWQKVRESYEPLVAHVNHRADLTYVIGEMVGELNAGHTYVGGGDYPKPERIRLGLLGAELEREPTSQYYRIKRILNGQNWDRNLRSPLTEIGVNVSEGDYILAVNGRPTNEMNNIYQALVNMAGKDVTLKVNSQPKPEGSRDAVVTPIENEQDLYYYNWVQGNIDKVSKATNGRVGYVHIPDMGVEGLNEFAKYFYPQMRKDGLIIDVRGNGGGNVSSMIIERLRREMVLISIARNTTAFPDPGEMHVGPKACLLDEFSASDGDIFPYRFKTYKLGKVIGKRSWGGVVGIRSSLPILDGGYFYKPEFSRYDVTGKEWVMEGHGVDPDIVVDNDPAAEYEGVDQQLNKAIEVVMAELQRRSPQLPSAPPYPDKSK